MVMQRVVVVWGMVALATLATGCGGDEAGSVDGDAAATSETQASDTLVADTTPTDVAPDVVQPDSAADSAVAPDSEDSAVPDDVADDTTVDDTLVDDTRVDDTLVDDTLVDDTLVDDTRVVDTSVDDTLVDDMFVDDTTPEVEEETVAEVIEETIEEVAADTVEPEPDVVQCVMTSGTFPIEGATHVASCSPVTYGTNPPTSGNHYPVWAAWQTYTTPVPRGFYVHDLEHGGIVFTYRCEDDCSADIAALQAVLDARPMDPTCQLGVNNRFVVTPDPLLDVRFAASAWGASIKGDCLDLAAITTFIDTYYGKGPEQLCAQGVDVTNPAVPGTYCPPTVP